MTKGNAMWGGRFSTKPHELVEAFNASVHFDQRLAMHDIAGSIAHVRMLARQGIIEQEEALQISAGLQRVRAEIEAGDFVWRSNLEDVHMNIEQRLTELVGPVGGKLHTARSRNDQVALDMHLFVRAELAVVAELVQRLQESIVDCAERHLDVIIPGFTHMQRAQPVLLAHHLLAYFWMLERDRSRLADAAKRADMMPLGAGAIAGTTFAIDRESVADELSFGALYENSMDAVSDRDYVIETLAVLSLIAVHLSRFAEEIIVWNTMEFGWIELDDAFATGSSMMPQKKNPDVAELVRGKAGRVFGHLLAMLATCKGLPLTYNKDLQEDKEGLFDALDTVKAGLALFAPMIATMTVRRDVIARSLERDFSAATDLADDLARRGLPFREAHAIVGGVVAYCVNQGKLLTELSQEEWQTLCPAAPYEILQRLVPQGCVEARAHRGGTAPSAVAAQLQMARSILSGRGAPGES